MCSENVERAELWILAARPPSRLETVKRVERVGLLVRHGRAAENKMLIIWLLRGLNWASLECSGWVWRFVVSSPWQQGCSRPSGLLVIAVVVVGEGGSKSTQVCGAEVPPLYVEAHNLLVLSVKDNVSGVGNCDAAGGRGKFVCYCFR